jgi:SAM-dependent methyltransferase
MYEDRIRAGSFGDDPERYDRTRPSYPADLIDELAPTGGESVVDVGCGTGIAARLFVAKGCRVVGVEQDERMAAVARRSGIDVDVSRFEDWTPRDTPFDVVASAQAWHWIDPVAGPAKAAAVLRPGGRLAVFWNNYRLDPVVLDTIRPVYEDHAPDVLADSVVLGTVPEDRREHTHEADIAAIVATHEFAPPVTRTYRWDARVSADRWIDELPSHSGHRVLPPDTLDAVIAGVAAVLAAAAIDRVEVRYSTWAVIATRLPTRPPRTRPAPASGP